MTIKERASCINTIEILRRLAFNVYGVIDVIDAENCEKIIQMLKQPDAEKTCCGYDVNELISFATACRRAGVDEKDLKNFAQDCEFAWKVMQKEICSAIEEAFEKYSDVSMCQDAEDTEEVIETQVGSLIFRDKVQYGIQEKLKAAYRDGYTAAYEMHCCGGSGARMVGESE